MGQGDLGGVKMLRHRPLVVFDLDGTLIDSVPLCASILNDMLAARGRPPRVRDNDVRPLASGGGGALVTSLLGSDIIDPTSDLAEFRARYAGAPTPTSSLYPGVVDGLLALKALGIRLAICSNKPQLLCDKILSELGINSLFCSVVGSRAGTPLKPEIDLMNILIDDAGQCNEHILYVGDSEIDVELASRMNIDLVLVTYGYGMFDSSALKAVKADSFEAVCTHIKCAFVLEADVTQARRPALG